MPIEKDKRRFVSIGNVLTILGMLGAVAVTYADNRVENARQKERVDNLKEKVEDVRRDSKDTNNKVDLILRKLEAMEAVQFAERRRMERAMTRGEERR